MRNITGLRNFTNAIANFTLAHTQLIAFQAMLKVQEIAEGTENLAAANQEISATTQEVTASTEELTATMHKINQGSLENIIKLNKLVEDGKKVEGILTDMVDHIQDLNSQIKDLNGINERVKEIADQTNLLSLNAAIEAARAGEHGRGFAVVAEEVRKLAGQTKEAVKNVKTITENVNSKASATEKGAISVQSSFQKYMQDSMDVAGVISEGSKQVENSVEMIDAISISMQQQAGAVESTAKLATELAGGVNFGKMIMDEAEHLSELVIPHIAILEEESVISILSARLVDHANFLRNVMSNAGKGGKIANHQECAFGKWYEENKVRYGHLPEYQAIDKPHQDVHDVAIAVVNRCTIEGVEKLLKASALILDAFLKLLNKVAAE